jgi:hypothetical protein
VISELIRDISSGSTYICLNEFHGVMFSARMDDAPGRVETEGQHRDRLVIHAARYLQEVFGLALTLLVTGPEDSLAAALAGRGGEEGHAGLKVVTISDFLERAKAGRGEQATQALASTQRECDEILAAGTAGRHGHGDLKAGQENKYRAHRSAREAARGCRDGSLLSGRVVRERGDSTQADVVLAGYANVGANSRLSTVRLLGRADINRAMNGDVVAILVSYASARIGCDSI